MKKNNFLLLSLLSIFSAQPLPIDPPQAVTVTKTDPEPEIELLKPQDIIGHAQVWLKQLPALESQETALLANFLYFSLLNFQHEAAIRNILNSLPINLARIIAELSTAESEARTRAVNTAALLTTLKEELLPVRGYSSKALQACLSEIEKSEYETLKKIVTSLDQYGKAVVTQFIKQDKASIEKSIENGNSPLKDNLEKIKLCNSILKDILDHKNRYLKDGDNADLADIEVAFSVADQLLNSANGISLGALIIKQMAIDIFNIHTFIFKNFYQTFYESLQKNKKVNPFAIMFDENGLIATDGRDEDMPAVGNGPLTVGKKHYLA